MSDKPYEKECIFCKGKIRISKESGKWLPYNLNNGPHDCKKKEEDTNKGKWRNKENRNGESKDYFDSRWNFKKAKVYSHRH